MPKPIGFICADEGKNEFKFVQKSGVSTCFIMPFTFTKEISEPVYFFGWSDDDLIMIYGDSTAPQCITSGDFIEDMPFIKELYRKLKFNSSNLGLEVKAKNDD